MADWTTALPDTAVEGELTHVEDHNALTAAVQEGRDKHDALEAAVGGIEIPEVPDLTDYAKKSDIPAPVDTSSFATKAEIPDVSSFVNESQVETIVLDNSLLVEGESVTELTVEQADGKTLLVQHTSTGREVSVEIPVSAGTGGYVPPRGPGRPDKPETTAGEITGTETVGDTYASTDGAGVGAWAWRLLGDGWHVADGDTGPIDMSDASPIEQPQPDIAVARLRRIGSTVYLTLDDWATGPNGDILNYGAIPVGFRPAGWANVYGGYGTPAVAAGPDGQVSSTDLSEVASYAVETSWLTEDAWPEAL